MIIKFCLFIVEDNFCKVINKSELQIDQIIQSENLLLIHNL